MVKAPTEPLVQLISIVPFKVEVVADQAVVPALVEWEQMVANMEEAEQLQNLEGAVV